jgi:HAD superfamily hydrolase (TIGR01509 family)
LNDQLIEVLYKLKANQHRLFLASNTNELHYNWINEKYTDELSIFNDEVISFKFGFRKPEREFFEYCVERSGVLSSECIFIDDRLDFVNVARKVGLLGV